MTLYVVKFSPAAAQEIEDAIRWYAEKNPIAADQFRANVFEAIEMISKSSLGWAKLAESEIRRFVISKYPYSLYFEVIGNIVQILSFAHNRRAAKYLRT